MTNSLHTVRTLRNSAPLNPAQLTTPRRVIPNRIFPVSRRHSSYARWSLAKPGKNTFSLEAAKGDVQVYEGTFGRWTVEPEDVREVMTYRIGITVGTVSLLAASSTAFLPEGNAVKQTLTGLLDPITIIGAAGLGTSLALVHIYVTPLKRFLQGLFGVGLAGTVAIMATQTEPAAQYVTSHPIAVLAVGPLFASVTGLAFKEGLCYGKFEAAGIFFVVPSLLLGHMFGWISSDGELALLAAFCILASLFAARKYTQPIKDDIGDKSVFEFQALPDEVKQQRIAEMNVMSSKTPEDQEY